MTNRIVEEKCPERNEIRDKYFLTDLVFVGGVERNFGQFRVFFSELGHISGIGFCTFEQSLFTRISFRLPGKRKKTEMRTSQEQLKSAPCSTLKETA